MNIVILDSGYKSYAFETELFENAGFQLIIHPSYKVDKKEKMEFAKDADGLLVRHTQIDDEFLQACPKLKAVVRYGVGYDNVHVEACTAHGVKAANVQGYANHAVSEHALGLMLACTRGMWDTRKQLLTGFAAPPAEDIFELHKLTLGIVGLGRIGGELSKKARFLFKNIIACDPYKPESYFNDLKAQKVSFNELLENADVISIHCNLTKETTHLLNGDAFKKMKKRPVVINTSRGETINEAALWEALENNRIHSAGLDVYENEPTTQKQDRLIQHPRTICTGHYAWYSNSAAKELQKRAARNLLDLMLNNEIEDALN